MTSCRNVFEMELYLLDVTFAYFYQYLVIIVNRSWQIVKFVGLKLLFYFLVCLINPNGFELIIFNLVSIFQANATQNSRLTLFPINGNF